MLPLPPGVAAAGATVAVVAAVSGPGRARVNGMHRLVVGDVIVVDVHRTAVVVVGHEGGDARTNVFFLLL